MWIWKYSMNPGGFHKQVHTICEARPLQELHTTTKISGGHFWNLHKLCKWGQISLVSRDKIIPMSRTSMPKGTSLVVAFSELQSQLTHQLYSPLAVYPVYRPGKIFRKQINCKLCELYSIHQYWSEPNSVLNVKVYIKRIYVRIPDYNPQL